MADADRASGPVGRTPRRPWLDRRVLLGVTGGIAAYKVVQVARDLTMLGASVDVVMTRSAAEFVGAISFEGVTGRRVHQHLVAAGHALDHIRLARQADVVCVAPATADFLARAAAGRSDDLLGAILLATRAPVLVCPAMNDRMWSHPQTQANARHLADELGYELVGPGVGPLAYGEGEGAGRMVEPERIVAHTGRALEARGQLEGRHVVVTAGPTREALDPVRYISNRSSGRMGHALASAAWRRGARVTLVAGPGGAGVPTGPEVILVETADEMNEAVRTAVQDAEALIMAAAVSDFRPAAPSARKIKKAEAPDSVALEPAPDVLAGVREVGPDGLLVVGFALETDDALEHARQKLEAKAMDLVVVNDATRPGSGFEVDTNEVVILDRAGGEDVLPLLPKEIVADRILDRLEALVGQRS